MRLLDHVPGKLPHAVLLHGYIKLQPENSRQIEKSLKIHYRTNIPARSFKQNHIYQPGNNGLNITITFQKIIIAFIKLLLITCYCTEDNWETWYYTTVCETLPLTPKGENFGKLYRTLWPKNQPGAAPTLALGAITGQNKNIESYTIKEKKILWCNCNRAKDGINAKIYIHLVGILNTIYPEDPHQNEEISTLF